MNKETVKEDRNKSLVLVVDDSRSVLGYVGTILSNCGYEVVTAEDGPTCLDLLRKREPDVLLLDVEVPDVDGVQVVDILSQRRLLCAVVLFVSLADLKRFWLDGLDRGVDDFINKTFHSEELIARIDVAVRTAQLKKELDCLRKRAKKSLVDQYLLQESIKEREKFSSLAKLAVGMAQEINNPIGNINNNLSSLRKYADILLDAVNVDGETQKITMIRQEIQLLFTDLMEGQKHLSAVVRALAFLSEVVDQEQAIPSDVRGVLNLIVEKIKKKSDRPLSISVTLDGPLWVAVFPEHLGLILENLLNNAVEACQESGTIDVKVWARDNMICLAIKDTGEGIEHENLGKVTTPFYTTRVSERQFGLGLAITDCLVQVNDGSMQITSSPGQGTYIFIRLPLWGESLPELIPEIRQHSDLATKIN